MGAFVGIFKTREFGAIIPVTNNGETIGFDVDEIPVIRGDGTVSTARLNITNVDILNDGVINNIVVLHRRSGESDYKQVASFSVEWSGEDNAGKFDIPNMGWTEGGIQHDFKVYFTNADGEKALEKSTGKVWGDDIYLEASAVFFGYRELDEYPVATGLRVVNASDPDGGSTGDPPSPIPNSMAKLVWDDMTKMPTGDYKLADGTIVTVSEEQWRNLKSYKVYMYVANEDDWPQTQHPTDNEPNGTWYLMGEFSKNYAEIECPHNSVVGFFVICVLKISGASVTDNIPYANFGVYSTE